MKLVITEDLKKTFAMIEKIIPRDSFNPYQWVLKNVKDIVTESATLVDFTLTLDEDNDINTYAQSTSFFFRLSRQLFINGTSETASDIEVSFGEFVVRYDAPMSCLLSYAIKGTGGERSLLSSGTGQEANERFLAGVIRAATAYITTGRLPDDGEVDGIGSSKTTEPPWLNVPHAVG